MYILNITSTIKKMSVTDIRYFVFKNYYKRLKKRFAVACNQIILDPCNAKEPYL